MNSLLSCLSLFLNLNHRIHKKIKLPSHISRVLNLLYINFSDFLEHIV